MKKDFTKIDYLLLLSTIIFIIPTILSSVSLIKLVIQPGGDTFVFWLFLIIAVIYLLALFAVYRRQRDDLLIEEIARSEGKPIPKDTPWRRRLSFLNYALLLFTLLWRPEQTDKSYLYWFISFLIALLLLIVYGVLIWYQQRKAAKAAPIEEKNFALIEDSNQDKKLFPFIPVITFLISLALSLIVMLYLIFAQHVPWTSAYFGFLLTFSMASLLITFSYLGYRRPTEQNKQLTLTDRLWLDFVLFCLINVLIMMDPYFLTNILPK